VTPYYQTLGLSEILPRYASLEALLPGRTVLEVGAATSTGGRSAAFLRSRAAKSVLSLDENASDLDEARREHVTVSELRFLAGRLEDVEGTFDLILVADAAPLVRVPTTLDCVPRLLRSGGHALLALRHPSGPTLAALTTEEPQDASPTWGELLSALTSRFACVEVATQTALVGYRISPSGTAPVETSVDATSVDVEEPAYFLALAGAQPSGVFGAEAIVALPAAPLAVGAGKRSETAQRLRFCEEELARLRERGSQS
jgi:SAM-dependent methyltransferase